MAKQITLDVPPDTYNTMRIKLETGRVMVLVLPDALSCSEAEQVVRELNELRDVVAAWQPS